MSKHRFSTGLTEISSRKVFHDGCAKRDIFSQQILNKNRLCLAHCALNRSFTVYLSKKKQKKTKKNCFVLPSGGLFLLFMGLNSPLSSLTSEQVCYKKGGDGKSVRTNGLVPINRLWPSRYLTTGSTRA